METSPTRRTHIQLACNNAGGVPTGFFSPSTTLLIGANNVGVVPILISDSGWAANFYSGQFMPDFIANLRVDQAWGDAQISGAVHQVKTTLAGAGTVLVDSVGAIAPVVGAPLAPVKY